MPEGFILSTSRQSLSRNSGRQSVGGESANESPQPQRPSSAKSGGRFVRTPPQHLPQLQQQQSKTPEAAGSTHCVAETATNLIRQSGSTNCVAETAMKLADDAAREAFRNASPVSSLRATSAGTFSAYSPESVCAAGDAEMWRRAFHTEAQECIRSLQAVFESASTAHFSSRLEDWRKFDLKATAQVQQHVKQLMHLNDALEDFLHHCSSPDELAKFKGALVTINACVDKLTTFGTELRVNIDDIVQRASSLVVNAWQVEASAASDLLQSTVQSQKERWSHDAAWQTDVDGRVGNLQACVERLCQEVQTQHDMVNSLSAKQKETSDATEIFLKGTVEDLRVVTRESVAQLTESLREQAAADLEEFKSYVQDVLNGGKDEISTGGNGDGSIETAGEENADGSIEIAGGNLIMPSVKHALGAIDHRLHMWENTSQKNMEHFRSKADGLEVELKDMSTQAAQWKSSTESALSDVANLERDVSNLRQSLDETEQLLDRAKSLSMIQCMKRLKEIESKGRIAVNRQTGEVRLVTPLVFTAPNPKEQSPEPAFVDPAAVEGALADVAEVAGMFEVQLKIEVQAKLPRGANQQAWDILVSSRAAHLGSELVHRGMLQELVVASGLAGPQNNDGIKLQFDKQLFAEAAKGGGAGKRGGSPKSPKRK